MKFNQEILLKEKWQPKKIDTGNKSLDETIHFVLVLQNEIEIRLNYAHLLAKGGSCWGHAGGKVLAVRMPVHGPGLAGGKKRNEPTGGAA